MNFAIRLKDGKALKDGAKLVPVAARPPLVQRLRAQPWMAVDAVIAAALLALLLVFAALGHAHHPPAHRVVLYVLAPAASLPLAVRRRWPRTVFAVVLTASVAFGILGSDISTVTGASYALYTVAVQADGTWSWLALVAAEAGVATSFGLTARSTSNPVNGAFTALIQLTIWIVGDSVRRHRGYTARLREQSLRQALADQRLQIARDLHDVIAHALSVIAVQAGVGSHLIATRPKQAASSLDAIQATAREALSETRYLLGALRGTDQDPASQDPASLAPVPRIGDLSALIDQLTEAGLPVTLRVEGPHRMLPASVEHSVYRIVQEALTNVIKHARQPATAAVVIRFHDDGDVTVEVADDGRDPPKMGQPETGSGYGLAGMRERIGLLGGELHAGPRADGGYLVTARLPAQAGLR
jgi:signal transduction histidine kinase